MTTFTFSIREHLRAAYTTFRRHAWFFIGTTFLYMMLNMFGGEHTPWIILVLGWVASFIASLIIMRIALAAAKNQDTLLTFDHIRAHVPTWTMIWHLVLIALLSGLLTMLGLVALIIPGIYIGLRLAFASYAYLDGQTTGARESLRYSWKITKGATWTIFLTGLVSILLYIVGLIALVVGILITAPIISILLARLYFALKEAHGSEAVAVQPEELPIHTETVESTETQV